MSLILYTCLILTGLGSPLSGWFLFDTSFEISRDCLKQRKSYEKEEKRKKRQRNHLYVFGKIVCFLLEQIPALNHGFGHIFSKLPFFVFHFLLLGIFLQKWGKSLAIVLSKSHQENWMRLSDALMRGWRLKKYKVTWSCTSSANNCGLKPLNLKSRPKLPNLWQ